MTISRNAMMRWVPVVMVVAALAGCGGPARTQSRGAPTTAQTVGRPGPSGAGPAGSTATPPPATSPPFTRPPRPTRPPGPTSSVTTTATRPPTASPPVTTTAPILPKIISWTIVYRDHEFTDFVLNEHGQDACLVTLWSLRMVLRPGDIPFRLYVKIDGQNFYDQSGLEGLPDPTVSVIPVQRSGPHDVNAELHIEFAGMTDIRNVHFGCRAFP